LTCLGLRTVRTIVDQGDGRDRTTIKLERIDPDRKLEASWRALRVIEEYANGLREIIKKLRRPPQLNRIRRAAM
jgi:hypothetical protein